MTSEPLFIRAMNLSFFTLFSPLCKYSEKVLFSARSALPSSPGATYTTEMHRPARTNPMNEHRRVVACLQVTCALPYGSPTCNTMCKQ